MPIIFTNRSPTKEGKPEINDKVYFVDLAHSTTSKRILCPLHINKPLMTYYADMNLYHCSSCGNIVNPNEESNKPMFHQDQKSVFLNDPYNSEYLTANGQGSTPIAFALESPHKRKELQSIDDSQDKDSIVYSSAEEVCMDDR
jgi:hypothetical protein